VIKKIEKQQVLDAARTGLMVETLIFGL